MNIFQRQSNEFATRHIGIQPHELSAMLQTIGVKSEEELIAATIPSAIRMQQNLPIPDAMSEFEYLQHIKQIANKNKVYKSYIGTGYYNTITPSVITRNIFENPGWYTQYTPYQAEIAQGRLESLLNFQTMVTDLTGLPVANASLLDEATAAAEAMSMFFHHNNKSATPDRVKFFVDESTFPQTKNVLETRAQPLQIEIVYGHYDTAELDKTYFGAYLQYPNNHGSIEDYRLFIAQAQQQQVLVVMGTDLLALTLLTPPGELGADAAIGSAQRFGVPMGFGGPHAAFFATKDEFKRAIPGRIIGVSVDSKGNRALRMALQTREQHIKREKATSNICTAQALLANMAAMYAVYHGPEGLKNIAKRVAVLTQTLATALEEAGFPVLHQHFFDTIQIKADTKEIREIAESYGLNFRYFSDKYVGISLDETTTKADILQILHVFVSAKEQATAALSFDDDAFLTSIPDFAVRHSDFLHHVVFNSYRSESQMMRYIKQLENKDLSLNTSMISLGSCTMKLNAATEMMPLSWPEFAHIHPFAPANQTQGYQEVIDTLSDYLCSITGFSACSLQPNSGAQGEYAGLLTIREYHIANGNANRNIVLIPISAHGTNPASAVMAGMKVVVVKSDEEGHIDVKDLEEKATLHSENLAALMVTYPSTHGVFEESIQTICNIVHQHGGQVYMDGANMNAQVALTSPAIIGADVCHLNLHKTFAIPHGGGGPGMGPICVASHLAAFLPSHHLFSHNQHKNNAVSAAPYGSASILLISYAYIKMLGADGLKQSTIYAIINANYMKARLDSYYKVLYTSTQGMAAHEFIIDLRPFKQTAGIEAEDVAKRLMDYGFHAPTMSFPVPGTIMIEPTESEDKAELDRFCDAMIAIYQEIKQIESGDFDRVDNPLKNAPHTQAEVCSSAWEHAYTREVAAFPLPYVRHNKFWPSVARVNNTHGDRNLICTCEPVESYVEA